VPTRLDAIDRQILRELQADGRMTNVELARALEEAGIITGYRALVDEKALGFDVVVFAFIHLASQAEADLAAFQAHVRDWPAVRSCWTLSGDIDFMLQCVAPDLRALQAVVAELTGLPNVRTVRTALALDRVKDEPIAPL